MTAVQFLHNLFGLLDTRERARFIGLIVITSALLVVPPALVAVTVALKVPLALGVPEIRPVLAFTFTSAGSPLAPYPVGGVLAVIW